MEAFCSDLASSKLFLSPADSVGDLCDQYHSRTRVLTSRPSAPWHSIEIAAAKTKRRKLERCWRKSQLHIDRQLLEDQCELVMVTVKQAKTRYYSCIISENASDQKALFNIVNRLLYRKTERQYPSCDSTLELRNNFSDFFVNKIAKIRTELPTFSTDDSALSFTIQLDIPRFNTALDSFIPTTETEVRGLICKTAKKSCFLDPISASLLVQCFDDLLHQQQQHESSTSHLHPVLFRHP